MGKLGEALGIGLLITMVLSIAVLFTLFLWAINPWVCAGVWLCFAVASATAYIYSRP